MSTITSDKKQKKEFVDFMMYMMKAPIIVFPNHESLITEELRDRAMLERMKNLKDIENKMCTDYEVCLYLSTSSLIAPLHHDFADIYSYAFSKCFDYNMIEPGITPKLEENQMQDLYRLKQWIFKKQKDALK